MEKKQIARLKKWEENLLRRERVLQLRSQGKGQIFGKYKKK